MDTVRGMGAGGNLNEQLGANVPSSFESHVILARPEREGVRGLRLEMEAIQKKLEDLENKLLPDSKSLSKRETKQVKKDLEYLRNKIEKAKTGKSNEVKWLEKGAEWNARKSELKEQISSLKEKAKNAPTSAERSFAQRKLDEAKNDLKKVENEMSWAQKRKIDKLAQKYKIAFDAVKTARSDAIRAEEALVQEDLDLEETEYENPIDEIEEERLIPLEKEACLYVASMTGISEDNVMKALELIRRQSPQAGEQLVEATFKSQDEYYRTLVSVLTEYLGK